MDVGLKILGVRNVLLEMSFSLGNKLMIYILQELQHLFDKLDVDNDGCVSFQEFLQGLFQHGGPATPSTPVQHTRSLSTPRQKLRFSVSMEDRTTTPAFITSGPGIFSSLNSDTSGYVNDYCHKLLHFSAFYTSILTETV